VIIRDATDADMTAVRNIYNATIPTSTVAWTETLETLKQRQAWFRHQQHNRYPVLVADDDGTVVGFTAYESFRGSGKWPGYRYTVELTIHVERSHWGRGVGRGLLETLISRARAEGIHVMVAAVDSQNLDSIRFHGRLGFTEVARMPQVGRKFDRWLDLVLLQRILDDSAVECLSAQAGLKHSTGSAPDGGVKPPAPRVSKSSSSPGVRRALGWDRGAPASLARVRHR
jgi:phosphinothricin acetyltransferase